MKSLIKVSVLAIALFAALACANDTTHREAAEEMLKASQVDKTLDNMTGQVKQILEQYYLQMGLPEESRPTYEKYAADMDALLKKALGWEKIKGEMITLYMEAYSKEELEEISKFFKSAVGQKYLTNLPDLTGKLITTAQQQMQQITPQLQEITDQMKDELFKSQAQQSMQEPPAPPNTGPAVEEAPAEKQ